MVFITPQIEEINPIDYYNQYCVKDAERILTKVKVIEKIGVGKYTERINKEDLKKASIILKDGFFIVKKENSVLDIKIEKFSPFMILQTLKFKSDFFRALSYVKTEYFKLGGKYVRVGTDYFKEIKSKDRYGIIRSELIGWKRQSIVDDYGTPELKRIERFDAFTTDPNNIEYKRVVGGKYNLYNEASFNYIDVSNISKKELEEMCKWSLIFTRHVFGEQYDLGLKYIKILWEMPKQILPILTLVSGGRHTGKSTFAYWISIITGENSVILNPQDIDSTFNGSYANKNILIIEESKFDNEKSIEKIKNLSTQEKITVNTKFIRHHSVPFFGKVIITSNNEDKFIRMDTEEIRYWVRKLEEISDEIYNEDMKGSLISEIPAFLTYIRDYVTIDDLGKTRMMFTSEMIRTKALDKVKKESRSTLHKELEYYFDEHALNNTEIELFYFTPGDVNAKYYKHNSKIGVSYIRTVLRDEMKLDMLQKPQKKTPFEENVNNGKSKTGRYFIYKNKYYTDPYKQNNNSSEEEDDGLPF